MCAVCKAGFKFTSIFLKNPVEISDDPVVMINRLEGGSPPDCQQMSLSLVNGLQSPSVSMSRVLSDKIQLGLQIHIETDCFNFVPD